MPRKPSTVDAMKTVPDMPTEPLRDDMRLTMAEAAAYFRVTPERVERWVREGKLDAITLPGGRGRRIRGSDVREWLRIPAAPAARSRAAAGR
jgi:excisionase family DNA binding protein